MGRADNEPPTLARAEGSLLCCSSRVFPNKTLIKPINMWSRRRCVNCCGKAGGENSGSIGHSSWGGTANPVQPARREGTAGPRGALQPFTDAKSDPRTDGQTVRAQLPRGMDPISQSLQPRYGMRGFVITLLDV